MTTKLFETALGIAEPWSVSRVDFDEGAKVLSILVDFKPGSRYLFLSLAHTDADIDRALIAAAAGFEAVVDLPDSVNVVIPQAPAT